MKKSHATTTFSFTAEDVRRTRVASEHCDANDCNNVALEPIHIRKKNFDQQRCSNVSPWLEDSYCDDVELDRMPMVLVDFVVVFHWSSSFSLNFHSNRHRNFSSSVPMENRSIYSSTGKFCPPRSSFCSDVHSFSSGLSTNKRSNRFVLEDDGSVQQQRRHFPRVDIVRRTLKRCMNKVEHKVQLNDYFRRDVPCSLDLNRHSLTVESKMYRSDSVLDVQRSPMLEESESAETIVEHCDSICLLSTADRQDELSNHSLDKFAIESNVFSLFSFFLEALENSNRWLNEEILSFRFYSPI